MRVPKGPEGLYLPFPQFAGLEISLALNGSKIEEKEGMPLPGPAELALDWIARNSKVKTPSRSLFARVLSVLRYAQTVLGPSRGMPSFSSILRLLVGVSLSVFLSSRAFAQEEGLARFRSIRSNPKLQAQLSKIVTVSVLRAFDEEAAMPTDLDEVFTKPLGVFVTAKRGEDVRGCMGSLQPKQASLAEEIAANLKLALFHDPRHRPVQKEEIKGMEFYLSTAGTPVSVQRISSLSPGRDAILLKLGAKESIVLPGEARTLRYLLSFARTKAGVKHQEPYQIYRLPVEVLSVKGN